MYKRKDLSLNDKNKLLAAYDALPKCNQRLAALKLGVSQSSLCKLLKNRKLWEHEIIRNENPNRKRMRCGKNGHVEEALLRWFVNERLQNSSITGNDLCAKAKELAIEIGEKDFIPTNGWLTRWKKRHNIHKHKLKDNSVIKDSQQVAAVTSTPKNQETIKIEENFMIDDAVKNEIVKKIIPTACEINNSFNILRNTLECRGGSNEDFQLLYALRERIENLFVKEFKQEF